MAAAPSDRDDFIAAQSDKELLRFITCGSVDDGKSSLIGRLLYESRALFEDQLATLASDSRRVGTQGENLDFALLLDGLSAEREQGITIDVSYRYFSTERRKFIVADTPGHEQYTRNMVTGASTADAAVILIDARRGVLPQTHRHSTIASLLGIRHVVVAVNKMDLVDEAENTFRAIESEFRQFADQLDFDDIEFIPVSALRGDNVVDPSSTMPWYRGPTLLGFLENVPIDEQRRTDEPLRMPVQWVNRPDQSFRGYAGTLASGSVRVGERVRVQPSARESTVARIVSFDGDLATAIAGQSITLTLADEIDISRGDIISAANDPAEVADQFDATLVWMDANALLPGRPYLMKIGSATINANVGELKYKLQVDTLEHLAAKTLELNEIGSVNLSLDQAIAFDAYARNRETGGFILIDRISNATVAAGMLNFALRRASNIHLQALDVDQSARSALMGHKPCVLWFTGLSGAGKSTIANAVEKLLLARGCHTYLLDGDNVRHGLNRNLGFTDADRVENIRRVAEVARLMADAGLMTLVSFISPFRQDRANARDIIDSDDFIEVFVDTSLAIAEQRDVKGLYKKARAGELKNFTGIDSPYERPEHADIRIDTESLDVDAAARQIISVMQQRGLFD